MSYAIISDVHILKDGDKQTKLLESFFHDCRETEVQNIVLLGDIVDIMIGSHQSYLEDYPTLLNLIRESLEGGHIVYYVEGNHDFHIQNLFKETLKKYWEKSFFLISNNFRRVIGTKTYCFAHGDLIEVGDFKHNAYRCFIKSKPLSFIANKLLSKNCIQAIGEKLSSTKRKLETYEQYDKSQTRENLRSSAIKFFKENKDVDVLVCGHSHVQDYYTINEKVYLNNGFPLADKTYLLIDEDKHELIELNY